MAENKFLNGLVTVIVSLALLGVVREFVEDAIEGASASEALLLGLITVFWVIATVLVVIKMAK